MLSVSGIWQFIHTAHRCTVQRKHCGAHVWKINWYVFHSLGYDLPGLFSQWEFTERSSQESCFLSACANWLTASVTLSSAAWWLYRGYGKIFLDIVTNVSALQLAVHVYTCILVCWTRLVCGHVKSANMLSVSGVWQFIHTAHRCTVQRKHCGAHVWKINWYTRVYLPGPFSVRIEELLLVCLCQLANCISYSKFSSMVIISRVWKFFLDIVTNVSALQLAVQYTCILVCWTRLVCGHVKSANMLIISRVWKFFLDTVTNVSALQLAVHVYTCILVCWTRLVCGHIKTVGLQIVEKLLKITFVVNVCLCVWECLTSCLVNN